LPRLFPPFEEIKVFTPAVVIFGMILIIGSIGLFLTSKFKPELYQESDNIYAAIGFVCGLILVFSLDLGAAMIFQQMLMIGALITLMWQFLQTRAENKRLKGGGRSAGREAPVRKSGYNARLDDEPEYAPVKRGGRRNDDRFDRQFQPSGYDDGYSEPERRGGRMLPGYAQQPEDSYQQDYPAYEEPAPAPRSRTDRRASSINDQDDWTAPSENRDWDDRPQPRPNRDVRRDEKPKNPPRNQKRRSSLEDSADEPAAKSSAYVEYEPVNPPPSGQPVEFPDQY
jgi:Ycf66 protein N-terminus